MTTQSRQSGFSLVELMIAMVLGLLLLAAVGGMFLANKRNDRENALIAEMQLNARFALGTLTRDLSMAGFYGGLPGSAEIVTTTVSISESCGPGTDNQAGWTLSAGPFQFIDNAAEPPGGTAKANATYGCLQNKHVVDGTDVIAIHRTSGLSVEQSGSAQKNTLYLDATHTQGSLYLCTASNCDPHPSNPAWKLWRYQAHLYFIRDYAHQKGDGINTLCRKYLAGQKLKTECIAAGVENMQLTFGVDTDGDGIPNQYLTSPNASQVANAITVHIQLLMRSPRKNPRLTNTNCYILQKGSAAETKICFSGANSHYYGRVVQATVRLRNLN